MSFKRFDAEDLVISAEPVAQPIWSTNEVELTTFFTSSVQEQEPSGQYYLDVYHLDPSTNIAADVQFSITFGHKTGGGTELFNNNVTGKSPSSSIYGQYRTLVLGDEDSEFYFGGVAQDYFYALTFDRDRYKEALLPGSFQLILGNGGDAITLIDDSKISTTAVNTDAGRVYQLILGDLVNGVDDTHNDNGYSAAAGSYGLLIPSIGVVILNGAALDAAVLSGGLALGTVTTADTAGGNLARLFDAINDTDAKSFKLNSQETISSQFVFVRARNSEFNYSTNPSNITGSGDLRHDIMVNAPQSYVTAVGLYNDNNELLAVAKLSRPLLKDFTKEALIRVKLDF